MTVETKIPSTARPLPPGACDSQVHVFGDRAKFPLAPTAPWDNPAATLDAALAMHAAIGIERGVLVQSSAYGTDHRALLDALDRAGENYRGIAVIDDSVSDATLASLERAGVKGARFNFFPALNLGMEPGELRRQVKRAVDRDWHVKLHINGCETTAITKIVEDLDATFVLDHMPAVWFDPTTDRERFDHVARLLDRGNWWLLLSNGNRASKLGRPWPDAVEIAGAYVEHAPERVIWATDWPHALIEDPPTESELLDLLFQFSSDPQAIHRILVDNPARLFGF
ncbi:amidohydrolase family protein [Amycolatopsis pithecellobii]|uniref:Amidohydrolase family protein n=1 Tax=Amycolatopsis pithecellobii TaxID=664692 RepID=A0A6N7Z122_9PSEU|nr:amidohydrolase family protein [Amycolatopsis pithecellobii]MTD58018.1 amidohydrolase family protein [Amycolatopsis pithecellobii]